jgi:ABC-2 type transport system ATP-binding protein
VIRLRTASLGKRFGDRVAVQGLTFEVRAGEVFGLLGPNGAGKTTTVRMLTGLLMPSEGTAEVCGLAVTPVNGTALRSRVGLLTETPGLYDRLTARENLAFFMRLHRLDASATWRRARSELALLGLAGREDEPCGGWSKGMRQKLAIVRSMLHRPEVLFLDEPTSGLDPDSARVVRELVASYAQEGHSVVLCSHNLPEVERLCERVGVVQGRLLGMGPVAELRRGELSLEVRLQGDASRFCSRLAQLAGVSGCVAQGSLLKMALDGEERASEVVAALVGEDALVLAVTPHRRSLEEVYLALTRREA